MCSTDNELSIFNKLPNELRVKICQYLPVDDLARCMRVCTTWNAWLHESHYLWALKQKQLCLTPKSMQLPHQTDEESQMVHCNCKFQISNALLKRWARATGHHVYSHMLSTCMSMYEMLNNFIKYINGKRITITNIIYGIYDVFVCIHEGMYVCIVYIPIYIYIHIFICIFL